MYTWKNSAVYVGQFKAGLKDGKGKWKKCQDKLSSNQYEGEYLHDKKNGYGIFQWESGNIYKGHYKDDEREGFGEMYWVDGSIYKGHWKKGIQHGIGKMVFPDGTLKEGHFENNQFIGLQDRQIQQIRSGSSPHSDFKIRSQKGSNKIKTVKSPGNLNPVQPPPKKDGNLSSDIDVAYGYNSQVY